MDAAELYDEIGAAFDACAVEDEPEIARIVGAVGPGPGWLLDAGIGSGRLAVPCAQAGWNVLGIDLSHLMLEAARAKAGAAGVADRVHLACMNVLRFHLAARFDVVLGIGVLFHLVDERQYARALANFATHLAPDGRLLVDVETSPDGGWGSDGRWRLISRWRNADGSTTALSVSSVAVPALRQQHGEFRKERVAADGRVLECKRFRQVSSYTSLETFEALLREADMSVERVWPDWGAAADAGHNTNALVCAKRVGAP